jgi:hypothetical protein
MAGQRKPTGGQLPRKDAAGANTTEMGVAHDHGDSDTRHVHRLGLLPHHHTDDGHVEFDDGRPPEIIAPEIPEPLPGAKAADYFNGDNDDREQLEVEAREIAQRRPDVIAANGHARPVSISAAPGGRLADVSSISSTLTLLGIPVELQDEFTWYQIAKHAIDSAIEELIQTRQPSDAALLTAAYDAVGHVVQARGLIRQEAKP